MIAGEMLCSGGGEKVASKASRRLRRGVVRAIHPSIVWGATQMCERALLRLSCASCVKAGGICGVEWLETVVTLWWWRAS